MKEEVLRLVRVKYGVEFFEFHIMLVVRNALLLAKQLGADEDITETSAYLHDIALFWKTGKFSIEEDHHIHGAEIARQILEEYGYDELFISKVEHCILAHRSSSDPDPETLEAEIIVCADNMAHFDGFAYMLKLFLEKYSFTDAVNLVRQKVERDWKKLTIPEARQAMQGKYEVIMSLLDLIETKAYAHKRVTTI